MKTVLGIDAAWTASQPSGVALVGEAASGWELVALEASYEDFYGLSRTTEFSGGGPNAHELLKTCHAICPGTVQVVAIDMPLSKHPITKRREADNAVSREYGGRYCSTHSPSEVRPGALSDQLRKSFGEAGYPLQTLEIEPPALIEVYPHPALLELARAPMRLPYKAAKTRKYWPTATLDERRALLFEQWRLIVDLIDAQIAGSAAALPELDFGSSAAQVKAYENKLDAVVCAWIGVCALTGRARPLGDSEAAIWIPLGS